MSFAATLAARHASMVSRFCTNADGQTMKVFFPDVPGPKAAAFPNAVTCQDGQSSKADKDLTGLLDRAAATYSISLATADLPAAYRRGERDTIPKSQILKVGYTSGTAISYRVVTSNSSRGLTQIDLETIS